MKQWIWASVGMCLIGAAVLGISIYQMTALKNPDLSFALPLGFGLLVCSIINFIVLIANRKEAYKTAKAQNDERIMMHGKSAFAFGFIITLAAAVAVILLDQLGGAALDGFHSATVILASGIIASLIHFIYKYYKF